MNPNQVQIPEVPFPPRTLAEDWLQLPEGEVVINSVAYRVEGLKPPRWQFWRSEKIKYNALVMTNHGRMFVVDPDNFTLEEKSIDNL